jgi:hypothetical protein
MSTAGVERELAQDCFTVDEQVGTVPAVSAGLAGRPRIAGGALAASAPHTAVGRRVVSPGIAMGGASGCTGRGLGQVRVRCSRRAVGAIRAIGAGAIEVRHGEPPVNISM